MRALKQLFRFSAIAAVWLAMANAAGAQTRSEWGTITHLEAGWVQDTVAVFHSAKMVNPNRCKVTSSYATNPADPGHSLFHTLLLSGLLNRRQVQLLVQGCVYDKPRIIAVGIR